MKPNMPPALLTPQTLDDSYYYDQRAPMPHPAIYPVQSQAYDNQQRTRLWRSIDDPIMQTKPVKDPVRPFPSAFSLQKPSQGRPMNPSQRFLPASPFHPGMRGIGPPNKSIVSRGDPIEFDRRDSFNEEGPFNRGNPFSKRRPFNKGGPFANRNPFNEGDPFNQGNPFNKGDPFNSGNPFSERDSMPGSEFGPTHEWNGRQEPNADTMPPGLLPQSMETPKDPFMRHGPMRRQSLAMLENIGQGEDQQARNFNPSERSDSSSEELISMVPRPRKAARSMIPQRGINNPFAGSMNRLRQSPWDNPENLGALGASRYPSLPMQYGADYPDYLESRNPPKLANRPLMLQSPPSQSRMADGEEVLGKENDGGLLKVPIVRKT